MKTQLRHAVTLTAAAAVFAAAGWWSPVTAADTRPTETAAPETVGPVRVIDLHVGSIAGADPYGRPRAEAMVRRLDEEFNRETFGRIRIRLGSYQVVEAPEGPMPCSGPEMDALMDHYGDEFASNVADDATGNLLVVVGQDPTCDKFYGALRRGAPLRGAGLQNWVHISLFDWSWTPKSAPQPTETGSKPTMDVHFMLEVLSAAMGPNMDPTRVQAPSLVPPSPLSTTGLARYGDVSSTLSGSLATFRLSAPELLDIGGMPEDHAQVISANPNTPGDLDDNPLTHTAEYTVNAMSADEGVRTLIVAQEQERAYNFSYRDGTGEDWPLDADHSVNKTGVYVYASTLAIDLRGHRSGRLLLSPPQEPPARDQDIRLGFQAGESVDLENGVSATVVAIRDGAATIRVTAPVDSTPPEVLWFNQCATVPDQGVCTLKEKRASKIVANAETLYDDNWAYSHQILVNGEVVATLKEPGTPVSTPLFDYFNAEDYVYPGSATGKSFSLPPGEHEVEETVTDAAGNVTSKTITVKVTADNTTDPGDNTPPNQGGKKLKKPSKVRNLRVAKRKQRRAVVRWRAPKHRHELKLRDYKIVYKQKRGKFKRLRDGVNTKRRVVLKKLKRNTTYVVRVSARTKAGWSKPRKIRFRTRR